MNFRVTKGYLSYTLQMKDVITSYNHKAIPNKLPSFFIHETVTVFIRDRSRD